jgi:hypothetical protein
MSRFLITTIPRLPRVPSASAPNRRHRGAAGQPLRSMRNLFLALSVSLGIWVSGCLLETRPPDPPADVEVVWTNPTSMSIVLTNVEKTFVAKSVTNYTRSLADDFSFIPDASDASLVGEAFFVGWNKDRETNVFSEVLKTPGQVLFTWPATGITAVDVPDKPDEKYYENLVYKMKFSRTSPDVADTTISGKVDLYMREASGIWSIFKWVDKRDGTPHATLGMVRYQGRVAY